MKDLYYLLLKQINDVLTDETLETERKLKSIKFLYEIHSKKD